MSHKKYREDTTCLNCGTTVAGKFCQNCGQENIEIRENFFHIAAHTVADFFHYDSKFLRTLKILITRPGVLTKEYLEGKRIRYVHPLRLLFFVTIVMVIIASLYYKKYEQKIKSENFSITEGKGKLQKKIPMTEMDAMRPEQREIAQKVFYAFDNVTYYLKYISFFLLPIYALGFKLLYIRRKQFYVDHLIHTMHVQSFAYIMLSLLLLIPLYITPATQGWNMWILLVLTFIYILISFRYLYRQSWIKTVLKTSLAIGFAVMVTSLVMGGFIGVMVLKSKMNL